MDHSSFEEDEPSSATRQTRSSQENVSDRRSGAVSSLDTATSRTETTDVSDYKSTAEGDTTNEETEGISYESETSFYDDTVADETDAWSEEKAPTRVEKKDKPREKKKGPAKPEKTDDKPGQEENKYTFVDLDQLSFRGQAAFKKVKREGELTPPPRAKPVKSPVEPPASSSSQERASDVYPHWSAEVLETIVREVVANRKLLMVLGLVLVVIVLIVVIILQTTGDNDATTRDPEWDK